MSFPVSLLDSLSLGESRDFNVAKLAWSNEFPGAALPLARWFQVRIGLSATPASCDSEADN